MSEFTPDTHSHLGDIEKTTKFYINHSRVMGSSHYAQARLLRGRNNWWTIPLTIIGVLVTVFPIIIARVDPEGEISLLFIFATLLGASALAGASIQAYLGYDARAGAHELAAGEYSRIRRAMEIFLCEAFDNERERFVAFRHLIELCVLCSSMSPEVDRKFIIFYQAKYAKRQDQSDACKP